MGTVFWDFDGTLAYSNHLWSGSMYRALTAVDQDSDVRFSQIRECNTRGFTWQTPERDHTRWTGEQWWLHFEAHAFCNYLSCGVDESHAAAAASLVRSFILDPAEYHLYHDTVSTLEQVKRLGFHNVILSNNYPELPRILEALGLLPYVDGIVISALEGYDKPRKELFDLAKDRYPDTNYIMIGDNPYADALGAHQAGMISLLVHGASSPLADYHTEQLEDILSVLAFLA